MVLTEVRADQNLAVRLLVQEKTWQDREEAGKQVFEGHRGSFRVG